MTIMTPEALLFHSQILQILQQTQKEGIPKPFYLHVALRDPCTHDIYKYHEKENTNATNGTIPRDQFMSKLERCSNNYRDLSALIRAAFKDHLDAKAF